MATVVDVATGLLNQTGGRLSYLWLERLAGTTAFDTATQKVEVKASNGLVSQVWAGPLVYTTDGGRFAVTKLTAGAPTFKPAKPGYIRTSEDDNITITVITNDVPGPPTDISDDVDLYEF